VENEPANLIVALLLHFHRWSRKAVSESVIDAVLRAWEMERHHAAERHLYEEVIPALEQIKQDHPDVVIGAVTDGKANPQHMTFTLGQYFDFCMNWEDDQRGRRKFFQELSKVEGKAELSWIYSAALERGKELAEAKAEIKIAAKGEDETKILEIGKDAVWIHVGDDLAYDVGGAAQMGAKTVLVELADKYGQTARHRWDKDREQPAWSVSSQKELDRRALMNEAAKEFVDEKLEFWHLLPEIINKILDDCSE
jgi:FMN phosphatase YigB (HAD superfamily)